MFTFIDLLSSSGYSKAERDNVPGHVLRQLLEVFQND